MIPVSSSRVPRTLFATAATLLLGFATTACEPTPPEPEGPIDAETYVAVMGELADLKRFPPPGSDYVTRRAREDSARQAILDRHGVAVDELLAFAEQVGARPERMLELTNRIIVISDSLARQRRETQPDSAAAELGTDTTGAATDTTGAATDSNAAAADTNGADSAAADSNAADSAAAAGRQLPKAAPGDTLIQRRKLESLRRRLGGLPKSP